MHAVITVGVSASGKSTWAREQHMKHGYQVVSRDDYRWAIMNEKRIDPSWANWKWKWEDEVTKRINADLERYAEQGFNLVIADTNLSPKILIGMQEKLFDLGYDTVELKYFPITWDEAIKRDSARAHGVGHAVLAKQFEQWTLLYGDDKVEARPDLPKAILVDIDGTVAKMNGKRGPFEWHRVGEDDFHEVVMLSVLGLYAAGYKVIFLSGRDSICQGETCEWIGRSPLNVIEGWDIFMRAEKDQRKDTVVKRELFDAHVRGKYDVHVVFDDRPSVARMWRDLGLNVIQIGNPYVEF